MARLHAEGFELGGSVAASQPGAGFCFWAVSASVTALSIQSTTKRSGSYAFRVGGSGQSLVSGTPAWGAIYNGNSQGGVHRVSVNFATLPSAENRILHVGSYLGAVDAWVTVDHNGVLRFYDAVGSTLLASSSSGAIVAGTTWYQIEIEAVFGATAGEDILGIRLDGTSLYRSTARTINNGASTIRMGGNLNSEAQTQGEWYFDDYVSDSVNYIGNAKVVHLFPDGTGDAATSVTRAGTDSGTLHGQVDEKPSPNDATDYLNLTANNSKFWVTVESSTTGGIGSGDTINCVYVSARARMASGTGSASWYPQVRSQALGTTSSGTQYPLANTSASPWGFLAAPSAATANALNFSVFPTDPQGGGSWTPSLLDSLQISGATTDGNPDTYITAICAVVEYAPAAGAGDQSVTGGTIASASTTYPGSVGVGVGGAAIASGAQLYAGSVGAAAQAVTGATIPAGSQLSAGSVGVGVSGATIGAGAQPFAGSVALTVTGATITTTAQTYAGTLSADGTLSGATIPTATQLHAGSLTLTLSGAHVSTTAQLHAGSLALAISGATRAAASQLFVGSLALAVSGAHRTSTTQLFAGTLALAVTGGTVGAGAQLYPGTLTAAGSVAGATIAAGSALYSGSLALALQGASLASTATLYSGAVAITLSGGYIPGGSSLFAGATAVAVTGAWVPSSAALYAGVVIPPPLGGAFLASGAVLYPGRVLVLVPAPATQIRALAYESRTRALLAESRTLRLAQESRRLSLEY